MKKLISIFLFFVLATALTVPFVYANSNNKQVVEHVTSDRRVLRSTLYYPNTSTKPYPLVVCLHSYGQSSTLWGNLPNLLTESGFAVLTIDFRGHGQSMYLSSLKQHSWMYLKKEDFQKFPVDTAEIIKNLTELYDNIDKSKIYFVGADIGANTTILTCSKLRYRPAGMVLITPTIEFKGLYTPIKLANAGNIPILAIASIKDIHSLKEIDNLSKYAQGDLNVMKLPRGGPGMTLIKNNKGANETIVHWLKSKE